MYREQKKQKELLKFFRFIVCIKYKLFTARSPFTVHDFNYRFIKLTSCLPDRNISVWLLLFRSCIGGLFFSLPSFSFLHSRSSFSLFFFFSSKKCVPFFAHSLNTIMTVPSMKNRPRVLFAPWLARTLNSQFVVLLEYP